MSADAYAKLVAHNNTVVQQFKTYKEAQERALAEAYSRLAALKEFCAKEREETREAFEKEKRELRDGFEREKRELRDGFEREKRALEKQSALALEKDRQSALALEKQSGRAVVTNQLVNKALADFFKNA